MESDLSTQRKLVLFDRIVKLLRKRYRIVDIESSGQKEYITVQKNDALERIEIDPYA